MKALAAEAGQKIIFAVAAAFFAAVTWISFTRWANFEYRTFDLAYYVQAIWQLIHGRFEVSVEHVPLLGNHVEPIVFLFAPLFAILRHPLLFVVVQNLALATMGPIGYAICRRLGFSPTNACLLGAALLLAPAASYIGLHEFHPEALTAPFLLLMIDARGKGSYWRYWLWFIAVLACKENMALLLAAYCVVQAFFERSRGWPELRRWYGWPLLVAVLWFFLCATVITPHFNSGRIDYLTLYNRLGHSGGEILRNALIKPQLFVKAIIDSLGQGNLFWALLLPFLALPLLRPRWLLIAAPILLQHLLSWRSSEWNIYFHYAAPLLSLFWIAAVEAIEPRLQTTSSGGLHSFLTHYAPSLGLIACLVAQLWIGPGPAIVTEAGDYVAGRADRLRKDAVLADIPVDASVVAPLPYLSHLATREKLYSLHYTLKGLQTLSHAVYDPPPPTDYVLIDYNDTATFDAGAGYYHPAMKTNDGAIIPSSDQLLHQFLRGATWSPNERDELTLLQKSNPMIRTGSGPSSRMSESFRLKDGSELLSLSRVENGAAAEVMQFQMFWTFPTQRTVFPWLILRLARDGKTVATITKGLCAPERGEGMTDETWHVTSWLGLPRGTYSAEALFLDNTKRAWTQMNGSSNPDAALLTPPIPLGDITVE